MDRDMKLGCAVIGFAVIAGIGLGWWFAKLPISVNDGLAFAGSIGGGAMAVIGALLVVSWDKVQRANEHREVMAALAEDALDWLENARDTFNADKSLEEQLDAAMTYAAACERLKMSRQWFAPQNIGMAKAYTTIEAIVPSEHPIARAPFPREFNGRMIAVRQRLDLNKSLLEQVIAELHIRSQAVRTRF
jgi:hypothetical protein